MTAYFCEPCQELAWEPKCSKCGQDLLPAKLVETRPLTPEEVADSHGPRGNVCAHCGYKWDSTEFDTEGRWYPGPCPACPVAAIPDLDLYLVTHCGVCGTDYRGGGGCPACAYNATHSTVRDRLPRHERHEPEPPAKTPGVKPLTIVETSVSITLEEMAGRVVQTMADHGPLLQAYHKVWYEAPHTWHFLHFLGVGMMKCPNDLWMYQELMAANRPRVVIETGTYQGGSALWFAFLMDMLAIEGGRVFTVDFEDHRRAQHPRITFLGGDSRDPAIRDAIAEEVKEIELDYGKGPRLISLDADHSADHVRRELELYAPLAQVGDYLVVEDTNISWGDAHEVRLTHPIDPRLLGWECSCGHRWPVGPLPNVEAMLARRHWPIPACPKDDGQGDRGARGGIEDYIKDHQGEFIQDPLCERWLLTMHPGGWLRRVKECEHG